eukprot:6003447-Pleurochrysis_carterae.AAC.2
MGQGGYMAIAFVVLSSIIPLSVGAVLFGRTAHPHGIVGLIETRNAAAQQLSTGVLQVRACGCLDGCPYSDFAALSFHTRFKFEHPVQRVLVIRC